MRNGKHTSKKLRQDPMLLRNDYPCIGMWDMPLIRDSGVDLSKIVLIAADHIKDNDASPNILKTVHFFVEDEKLDKYFYDPYTYLDRLAQYAHVFTPDFSLYSDMPMAIQVYSTFKNRWCGACWQEHGLSVIPTIGWSTPKSFEFCFDGIQPGSAVAISTLGVLHDKESFLEGYYAMKKIIDPRQILCFGKPFNEIEDDVLFVDYLETTRRSNNGKQR